MNDRDVEVFRSCLSFPCPFHKPEVVSANSIATMRSLHSHLLAIVALTVVPGLKTIAKAQDLAGLPECAKPALLAAFQASGCKATDADCLCSNPNLLTSLQSYIEGACSPADQAAVLAFGETYCGKQGTTLPGHAPAPATTTATSTSTNYHETTAYSTTATTTATSSMSTGGAVETGLSAAALAVVMGGMGWIFAEL